MSTTTYGGAALVAQSPFELKMLLRVFAMVQPRTALEIGVWHGGTLAHWLQGCRKVVAIDSMMLEMERWRDWGQDLGSDLQLLHGESGDPAIVRRARQHAPYDFILIDADHTYESARRDWENYGPMVAEGGVVCFHDIRPRPEYGVAELWSEIKEEPGARTLEILHRGGSAESDGLTTGYDPGIGVWFA